MSDVQPASPIRPPVLRPGHTLSRKPSRGVPLGPSPKVRRAISLMIWGAEDGQPVARREAAKLAGLADETLRKAFRSQAVRKAYNDELEVLRTSARPRALHKIEHLSQSAVSERVQLEAAKYLDGGAERAAGVVVNVGVNVQPGYLVTVPGDVSGDARQMLKLAGSHANVLDMQADVPTDEAGTP